MAKPHPRSARWWGCGCGFEGPKSARPRTIAPWPPPRPIAFRNGRQVSAFSLHMQMARTGWNSDVDPFDADEKNVPMLEASPKARADLKPGTLYAILGEQEWIYYGQVTTDKRLGFFRHRDREVAALEAIVTSPIMSVMSVVYPSITRALRSGRWQKLGRCELVHDLQRGRRMVQWPAGTLTVTVWDEGGTGTETRVDDPTIQDLEVIAGWDAEQHIPSRLTTDFGQETGEWNVGGPVWRERKLKEELARRHPEAPWHQLPTDWVPTVAP